MVVAIRGNTLLQISLSIGVILSKPHIPKKIDSLSDSVHFVRNGLQDFAPARAMVFTARSRRPSGRCRMTTLPLPLRRAPSARGSAAASAPRRRRPASCRASFRRVVVSSFRPTQNETAPLVVFGHRIPLVSWAESSGRSG